MTRKSAKSKAASAAPPAGVIPSAAPEPATRTRKKAARSRAAPASPPPATAAAERKAALKARSGVKLPPPPSREPVDYPIGKGRKQLKGIAIYMHPLAKEALDRIARSEQRTVQELGLEALNLLFRHYGEKPIA